jgi:hypothetical protein
MDSATADMLQFALAAPLGFYKRADTIVRLLTNENVGEVMGRLPAPILAEFKRYALEAYVPRGPRFAVTGPVVPESNLEALRTWLAATEAAAARKHVEAFEFSALETSPLPAPPPQPARVSTVAEYQWPTATA